MRTITDVFFVAVIEDYDYDTISIDIENELFGGVYILDKIAFNDPYQLYHLKCDIKMNNHVRFTYLNTHMGSLIEDDLGYNHAKDLFNHDALIAPPGTDTYSVYSYILGAQYQTAITIFVN